MQAVKDDDWVLAADVGGTYARLGLFAAVEGKLQARCTERYRVSDFAEPEDLLAGFLGACDARPRFACLGVAGPVLAGRCRLTNRDWVFEAEFLNQQLGLTRLELRNDLECMALGLDDLAPSARLTLQTGTPLDSGRIGLLAVGTGLGEALRLRADGCAVVAVGEGGHVDFAVRDDRDWRLLAFLRERHGEHISWERVLSGDGLVALYQFLCAQAGREPIGGEDADPAALVIRRGLDTGDATCAEALQWFVELLAAEAGNLALRGLCLDGVYLGGGLPPRLRRLLEAPEFARAFSAKGRFQSLLEQVPVYLVGDDDAALFGAARCALRLGG